MKYYLTRSFKIGNQNIVDKKLSAVLLRVDAYNADIGFYKNGKFYNERGPAYIDFTSGRLRFKLNNINYDDYGISISFCKIKEWKRYCKLLMFT